MICLEQFITLAADNFTVDRLSAELRCVFTEVIFCFQKVKQFARFRSNLSCAYFREELMD